MRKNPGGEAFGPKRDVVGVSIGATGSGATGSAGVCPSGGVGLTSSEPPDTKRPGTLRNESFDGWKAGLFATDDDLGTKEEATTVCSSNARVRPLRFGILYNNQI